MNARRLGLLAALLVTVTCVSEYATSQGMKFKEVDPVYQSEGRQRIVFNTSCISANWTPVVSSDTIARSTVVQIAWNANIAPVCLGTSGAQGTCSASAAGVELGTTTPTLYTYGKGEVWCESSGVSQNVKGYRTRDKDDYGRIGASDLQ